MDNYIKGLIAKNQIAEIEKQVISHGGNMPKLRQYGERLNELQEMIVKIIYLAGGMYMSDLRMLFAFSYETQSVERAVKELIADGYLINMKTPYGMLYGLTKSGVERIKCHDNYYDGSFPVNCQDMDLSCDGAYLKRKCISYTVASYVFNSRLQELWEGFYKTDKLERNHYLCRQYLKNITYRELLEMNYDDKMQFMSDIHFSDMEKDLFVGAEKYIVARADAFANIAFEKWGFESIKELPKYREYISIIKRSALREPSFNTFYLLKDMMGQQKGNTYKELSLCLAWKCSITKYGDNKFRKAYETNALVKREQQLDELNQILGIMQNERRSLVNRNAYKKKTDDSGLEEILVKLSKLDTAIDACKKQKDILETDFSFSVLKSYDGAENDYEERVITLNRLRQNAVFVEAVSDSKAIIYMMQTNEEYFDLLSLHKKLSMAYQLLRRLCPLVSDISVRIYTYTADQQKFIESILPALEKKLLAVRETAYLGNTFMESCEVKMASDNLKERYIFYQGILNQLEKGNEYE